MARITQDAPKRQHWPTVGAGSASTVHTYTLADLWLCGVIFLRSGAILDPLGLPYAEQIR